MATYTAITSATTTTLITKDGTFSGNIQKITICNNSANAATSISVHFWSGTVGHPVHPLVHNVTIPSGATLVLEDNVSFNSNSFNLRITTAGTSPNISVILR